MMKTEPIRFTFLLLLAAAFVVSVTARTPFPWQENARKVHAKFTGRRGTFAQFGDSITVTQAFWSPLLYTRKNASAEMERAFQTVKAYLRPECWGEWKGAEFGSEGGQTVRWAYDHVGEWLRKLNPEVALLMFGSNDLHSLEREEYVTKMRAVIQKCLDNGTVVLLSTIPPRHGYEKRAAEFAEAIREIARAMKLPLTDFYAEVRRRRPKDWDGAQDTFKSYEGYDVPTLLARDGVHPSHPQKYQNDYSDEALRNCGYSLRNHLVLMKYAEVVEALRASPQIQDQKSKIKNLTGAVIRVSTPDELLQAVERVKPGGAILLADGLYRMSRYFQIKTNDVTLRGESGKREQVILDGTDTHGELLGLTACSGVTIADLTVQNVKWNGIKLNSETNVQRVTIQNCVLHNIWQRAIKGVKVPEEDREMIRPKSCRVQQCLFYNDHPKRFADDNADTPETFNGNYIGGIDVMYPRDWIIRDNVFMGIHGRTGEARGAIFLWHDARNCIVERNVILDCDSGICLGNSSRPMDITTHCTGCIVRNNFVTRAPENGILADYTRDCKILHNTVHDPDSRLGRLIRLVHDNDGLLVANNLLSGPPIRNESDSRIVFRQNLEKNVTTAFVAPAEGNLRLTNRAIEAIHKAVPLADVTEDIDRKRRGPKPDIGAHELSPD